MDGGKVDEAAQGREPSCVTDHGDDAPFLHCCENGIFFGCFCPWGIAGSLGAHCQEIVVCWDLVLQRWHGCSNVGGVVQHTKYLPNNPANASTSAKVSDKSRFHPRIKSELQLSGVTENVGGVGEMHMQSIP